MNILAQLTEVFSMLSVLAIGGGTAVLPEMQWSLNHYFGVTHTQFVHAYSIGQIAPGPNMLSVLIMGELVDGMAGAACAVLAFFIPSSILCLAAGRLWEKSKNSPWRTSVQNSLEPLSLGLMCSGVYTISHEALNSTAACFIAISALALLFRTKASPVLIIISAGFASLAASYL